MAYTFSTFEQKTAELSEWLKKELVGIQTGRATPALLDSITVESYGARMPIKQVASVTVEDARTLRIVPWDKGQVSDIEKAIQVANLGVSVGSDDQGVRVSFPELTTERREGLAKMVRTKLEEARIRLRSHRDDVWQDIQTQEKSGKMSEDEKFRAKEKMEEINKKSQDALALLAENKEKDLSA